MPGTPGTPATPPSPRTLRCARPTGRLNGLSLGPLALGWTRARARATLRNFNVTHNDLHNFCLAAGWGIRVGYPSAKLLRELSSRQRARVAGRIILALTANRYYALDGVRPGRRLATVAARLGAGRPLSIGLNDWYVVRGRASDGVLKVRRGVVQEVGIASKQLCHGRAAQRRLLRSFTAP